MNIEENVSLADHSTMRLGGKARYLAEVSSEELLAELADWAKSQNLPVIMIGRGSNIFWRDEGFNGLVLVNTIMGRQIIAEDDYSVTIKIRAGENWDEFVGWTVDKQLTGIEYMSLIPGTAGAAPVQNVGAYGGELANTLVEVEAYDTQAGAFVKIANKDCGFSYRNSRFKTKEHGRFLITSITLKLSKTSPAPPFYESLQKYLDEVGVHEYTSMTIREAVIAIRRRKLPDPETVANNGSFFTNPFIETNKFQGLKAKYPEIVGWPAKDGRMKIAAGWLVERAGFKGIHDQQTGMATWPDQALVLVNENAKSTADLLVFRQKILDKVQEMFGITLAQEPELLP